MIIGWFRHQEWVRGTVEPGPGVSNFFSFCRFNFKGGNNSFVFYFILFLQPDKIQLPHLYIYKVASVKKREAIQNKVLYSFQNFWCEFLCTESLQKSGLFCWSLKHTCCKEKKFWTSFISRTGTEQEMLTLYFTDRTQTEVLGWFPSSLLTLLRGEILFTLL